MKKVLVIVLVIAMSAALFGCGSASPSDVVDTYLGALKAQDADTVAKVYSGDSGADLLSDVTESDEFPEEISSDFTDMMLSFDYSLSNEQISGDSATVDVTIGTYDFGSMFKSVIGDYFTKAFGMAFSGASEDEMEQVLVDLFAEKIAEMKEGEHDFEATATISLSKVDGEWKINAIDDDSDFINCLTGDMTSALTDISDSFDME